MSKTIHEWFLEAKENGAEWADNAINTTIELRGPKRLTLECPGLKRALYSAFSWIESPQGHKYWEEIAISLKNA